MRNKLIAILGTAVILVGTIGGVAFASGINNNSKDKQPIAVKESSTRVKQTTFENSNEKTKDNINYNQNSANNPSKDVYQDMIKVMRDNGFKDAARYMQTGNYAAMTDYMNNLSQADYDKMIKIMNDNNYGYMAQMMQSIGKEGMTQMHNSISRNANNSNGMMGNFRY